jgi:hypothetical protein
MDTLVVSTSSCTVRQNAVKGRISSPESGKAREIALSNETISVLKSHRHPASPVDGPIACSAWASTQ